MAWNTFFFVLASLLLIAWLISFLYFAGEGVKGNFVCIAAAALRGL
jgi:hypothetical protein